MLSLAQTPQRVLDDDDRPIHDQAEIQRTKAHQVCGHASLQHAGGGQQHGHGNDHRSDQRRTKVAEQRKQHNDD